MRIVVRGAGAQRGLLLVKRGGQLLVTAAHEGGDQEVAILPPTPLDVPGPAGRPRLPAGIAYQAAHGRQPVVYDDVAAAGDFAGDPYVAARRPRAMLCLPLLYQGRLAGLLYLENNETAGAF